MTNNVPNKDLLQFSADQLVDEKGINATSHVDQLIADALEKGDEEAQTYYKMLKSEVERFLALT